MIFANILVILVFLCGLPSTCCFVGSEYEDRVGVVSPGDKEYTLVVEEEFAQMVAALSLNSSQLMPPGALERPVCSNVWVGLNLFQGGHGGWFATFGHWLGDSWQMSTGETGQCGSSGRVQGCCVSGTCFG